MADSDGEYIDHLSDEGPDAHLVTRQGGGNSTRARARAPRPPHPPGLAGGGVAPTHASTSTQAPQARARWEDIQRSWDSVLEGADGTITHAVSHLLEASKRQRLVRDTTPLRRGIIRHLILILDLSSAMAETDLRPSRYRLTLRYACEFVTEFFEQNPISQLGVVGMRDGLAVRVGDMSGDPTELVGAIQALRGSEPKGYPSLQNALEMARAALFGAPAHGTREVLVVFGALMSVDPGDVHRTVAALVRDRVRVGVVGLAAQVAICRELVGKTNAGDDSAYGVALNEQHFRDLFLEATTPPITRATTTTTTQSASASSLLMMGFPSRIVETHSSLCACHSKLTRGGYLCSRCNAKICLLPVECPSCGLTLILSTHLARSYHHLFPLRNWTEVSWERARVRRSTCCFACRTLFPTVPENVDIRDDDGGGGGVGGKEREKDKENGGGGVKGKKSGTGTNPSSRYECTTCGNHFCIDCDVWSHEVVHNCPGCQSGGGGQGGGTLPQQEDQRGIMVNGVDVNGEAVVERMDVR